MVVFHSYVSLPEGKATIYPTKTFHLHPPSSLQHLRPLHFLCLHWCSPRCRWLAPLRDFVAAACGFSSPGSCWRIHKALQILWAHIWFHRPPLSQMLRFHDISVYVYVSFPSWIQFVLNKPKRITHMQSSINDHLLISSLLSIMMIPYGTPMNVAILSYEKSPVTYPSPSDPLVSYQSLSTDTPVQSKIMSFW